MRDPVETSAMTVDLEVGCGVVVGGGLSITLLQKSGRKARVRIEAPRDVRIEKQPAHACSGKPSMAT